MTGFHVLATDGKIGTLSDAYFDETRWAVSYFIIDTGHWLPGRLVLIPTGVMGKPDTGAQQTPVSLSKEQVQNSPDIDTQLPVSRESESLLAKYYGWATRGQKGGLPEPLGSSIAAEGGSDTKKAVEGIARSSLRSAKEVVGYRIHADDGAIGHVEDLLVEIESWDIRYAVVDTRNWLPGRKVLLSPTWIERVTWAESELRVMLSKEVIRNSPKYEPSTRVDRKYEEALFDHYGCRKYWE
jgi:hypothetical protein